MSQPLSVTSVSGDSTSSSSSRGASGDGERLLMPPPPPPLDDGVATVTNVEISPWQVKEKNVEVIFLFSLNL
jgi:hypothetical protein